MLPLSGNEPFVASGSNEAAAADAPSRELRQDASAVAHDEPCVRCRSIRVHVSYAGRSSVKWSRFLREAELNVSIEEWRLRFGHADLLAQWDEERNGPLKPSDFSRCDSA
jgi:hypothetical protein